MDGLRLDSDVILESIKLPFECGRHGVQVASLLAAVGIGLGVAVLGVLLVDVLKELLVLKLYLVEGRTAGLLDAALLARGDDVTWLADVVEAGLKLLNVEVGCLEESMLWYVPLARGGCGYQVSTGTGCEWRAGGEGCRVLSSSPG